MDTMRAVIRQLEGACGRAFVGEAKGSGRPQLFDPYGAKVSILQGRPALVQTDGYSEADKFDLATMQKAMLVRWLTPDEPITPALLGQMEGRKPDVSGKQFVIDLGAGKIPRYIRGEISARWEDASYPVALSDLNNAEMAKLARALTDEQYDDVTGIEGTAKQWEQALRERTLDTVLEGPLGDMVDALITQRMRRRKPEGQAWWGALPGVYATTAKGAFKFLVRRNGGIVR